MVHQHGHLVTQWLCPWGSARWLRWGTWPAWPDTCSPAGGFCSVQRSPDAFDAQSVHTAPLFVGPLLQSTQLPQHHNSLCETRDTYSCVFRLCVGFLSDFRSVYLWLFQSIISTLANATSAFSPVDDNTPSGLPMSSMAAGSAVMEGELLKWTNYFSGWQSRYVVVQDGMLSYYASKDDVGKVCGMGSEGFASASACPLCGPGHVQATAIG